MSNSKLNRERLVRPRALDLLLRRNEQADLLVPEGELLFLDTREITCDRCRVAGLGGLLDRNAGGQCRHQKNRGNQREGWTPEFEEHVCLRQRVLPRSATPPVVWASYTSMRFRIKGEATPQAPPPGSETCSQGSFPKRGNEARHPPRTDGDPARRRHGNPHSPFRFSFSLAIHGVSDTAAGKATGAGRCGGCRRCLSRQSSTPTAPSNLPGFRASRRARVQDTHRPGRQSTVCS